MSGIGFYFYDRFALIYVNRSGNLTSKDKNSIKPETFLDEGYSDDNERFDVIPFFSNLTVFHKQNISPQSPEIKVWSILEPLIVE